MPKTETVTVTCPICRQSVQATPVDPTRARMKPHDRWVYGDEINLRGGKRQTACMGSKCAVAVKA